MANMTEKRSRVVAEGLGEEALNAYLNGGEWEYTPEDIEGGDAWAYKCGESDCGRQWHKQWFLSGYTVTKGKVSHDLHVCDEDGDWDCLYSCDVDGPDYDEWIKDNFSEEDRQQGWKDYAANVAMTGEDPLGNYTVQRDHKEAWTAKLIQDGQGVKFYGAHRQSLAFVDRVAEKDVDKLPEAVRQFLAIDGAGVVGSYTSLDQLNGGGDSYRLERGDGFALVTFEIQVKDDPQMIQQRLREAAETDEG